MSSVNGVTSSSNGGVSVSGAGGGPGGSTTRALVTPPSTSESPELSMVLEKAQVLLTKVEHSVFYVRSYLKNLQVPLNLLTHFH